MVTIGLALTMLCGGVGCSCLGGGGNSSSGNDSVDNSVNSSTGNTSVPDVVLPDKEAEYTNVVLADDGRSDYSIVIPANASDCVANAAQELKRYFSGATGAILNVITDEDITFDRNAKYISLGETTIFDGCGMTVDVNQLNRDGYKIKTYGNTVVIGAAKDIGVLYGVYEFLAYQVAFEPYAVDEIYYKKVDTLYLADLDVVDAPSFVGRVTDGPMQFETYGSMLLRYRNNTVTSSVYDYGDSKTFAPGHSETYAYIIPSSKYNNEGDPDNYHPEWFSNATIQICLTNEALIEEAIKNCIEIVKNNPDATYLNISQNDGDGWCHCADCAAEQRKYKTSGYAVRFVNKVIEGVEEWRIENQPTRDLKYAMFAYASALMPPVVYNPETDKYAPLDESVIPHEKLSIRLTALNACYSHAFNDPNCATNVNQLSYMKGWRDISAEDMNMTIYDYCANYHNYLIFLDTYAGLKENLKSYQELGITEIYRQNATGATVKTMGDLETYLMAKLMWNVDLDLNTLMDNFFTNYYKTAAPYMRKYFDHMRNYIAWKNANTSGGFHMQLYDTYSPSLNRASTWPIRVLEQAQEYLQQALAATQLGEDAAQNEILYDRVLKEIACSKYLIAINYDEYYTVDKTSYLAWIDQWEAECLRTGVSIWKEKVSQGGAISALIEKLRSEA